MNTIINLENGKLKMYSLNFNKRNRFTQILGEIAVLGGKENHISKINVSDGYYDYNSKTVFQVNEKTYNTYPEIKGNETEIKVNYYAHHTGVKKWVGRDEYERLAEVIEERYTLYQVPELYRILGAIYYYGDARSFSSLDKFINFINDSHGSNETKKNIEISKKKIIQELNLEKYDDSVVEAIKELNRLSSIDALLNIYKEEVLSLIYLEEYDNNFIIDLNKIYEFVINNQSSLINVKKFCDKYDVYKYNFEGVNKKILKKQYNPTKNQ